MLSLLRNSIRIEKMLNVSALQLWFPRKSQIPFFVFGFELLYRFVVGLIIKLIINSGTVEMSAFLASSNG